MSAAFAEVLEDLHAYRDAVTDADPVKIWARTAQHHLKGVIFWTVNASNVVSLSVGAGLSGADLLPEEAENTSIYDWSSSAINVIQETRDTGNFFRCVKETEGPGAGRTFITSAVLHPSGDVVCMTVDLSALDGSSDMLCHLCEL